MKRLTSECVQEKALESQLGSGGESDGDAVILKIDLEEAKLEISQLRKELEKERAEKEQYKQQAKSGSGSSEELVALQKKLVSKNELLQEMNDEMSRTQRQLLMMKQEGDGGEAMHKLREIEAKFAADREELNNELAQAQYKLIAAQDEIEDLKASARTKRSGKR